MTNEEKQILLKDLCARLPYILYIRVEEFNVPENDGRITEGFIGNYLKDNRCNDYDAEGILNEFADGCINVKPYLRPMSSMIEEESKEFALLQTDFYVDGILYPIAATNMVNWLNSHYFDYSGLIEKGLALEAPEGMYKTE